MNRSLRRLLAVAVLCACSIAASQAETGVSEHEILIGSCLDKSGSNKELGQAYMEGSKAYVDYINAEKDGVHGRKLRILHLDDKYEPDNAISCYNDLLKQGVFVTGLSVGSPTSAKYVPMAISNDVPFIGISAGPPFMYENKRQIFAVRASYEDETRAEIDHLWNDLGIRKIGVIYQNDAFGAAGLEGAKKALAKYGAAPTATGAYKRGTTEIEQAYASVKAANPEAVILVAVHKPAAAVLKKAQQDGWKTIWVTVAGRDTQLMDAAGTAAEGVVVANATPTPEQKQLPSVALFNKLLKKYVPGAKPGALSLQSFIDTMVIVEALNRAGQSPTRDRFIAGLESMSSYDIGLGTDFRINYSPKDHKAFETMFFTVIRKGKVVALKDWKALAPKKG